MIRETDGQILRWKTGMERMYGYTRAEAEQRPRINYWKPSSHVAKPIINSRYCATEVLGGES